RRYGRDLIVERPLVLRGGSALVRQQRVLVELGARHSIFGGDQLGTRALVEPAVKTRRLQRGFVACHGGSAHLAGARYYGRAHRHTGHHFHATRDDDVGLPGDHRGRGGGDGLL